MNPSGMEHFAGKICNQRKAYLALMAQTVTQASWGLLKEDKMDVEPCYPLFSAELHIVSRGTG